MNPRTAQSTAEDSASDDVFGVFGDLVAGDEGSVLNDVLRQFAAVRSRLVNSLNFEINMWCFWFSPPRNQLPKQQTNKTKQNKTK